MAKDLTINKTATPARFGDPFMEMDRMMERFFETPFGSLINPQILTQRKSGSIQETDQGYILSLEVPGIPMSGINIDVSGNLLTIKAESESKSGDEDEYRRDYRNYFQSYTLPSNVDADKIEASCENGLLQVLLPKTEATLPKRIEVRSEKGGLWSRLTGKEKKNVTDTAEKKH